MQKALGRIARRKSKGTGFMDAMESHIQKRKERADWSEL
jgi:hypothetical protein